MHAPHKILATLLLSLVVCGAATGQAGRRASAPNTAERAVTLNVIAAREDGSVGGLRVTAKEVSVYDGGIEQTIQSFAPDPSPARIVLLVDNSLTLRADVDKLAQVAREFAYEIYEGDQLMVVGYDEKPEIVVDWTDDAKKVEAALPTLRKRGDPRLFDAFNAVIQDALQPFASGVRKRIVVLVGDGLDRGSQTQFAGILSQLQAEDITVYALQIPDRTGGALRRDRLKAGQVVQQLVEGTGGRIFTLNEPGESAKMICDELRNNRYVLAYAPSIYTYTEARRILVAADPGISVRFKTIMK